MNAQASLQDLHNDKRGAIMLMGLCMSCFLIGSLWFLIGIGDSIVFRDTMQEATDHATFTSAALHAKGMNFISACNLLLLALIAVHIIMGIIHDVLLALCIASIGFGCGPWLSWRKVYTGYSKIFKPIAGAIHLAEVGAAYAYPLLGAYKGYTTGKDYSEFGPKKHDITMIVVSPSLIPGSGLTALMNKAFTRTGKGKPGKDGKPTDGKGFTSDASGAKKGLPVEAKKFSDVCTLISNKAMDAVFGASGKGGSSVMGTVKGWIGTILTFRYCNDLGKESPDISSKLSDGNSEVDSENQKNKDKKGSTPLTKAPVPGGGGGEGGEGGGLAQCMKDGSGLDPGLDKWWGCDGPLVPWGGTSNGSPWNQVWGLNLHPEFNDDQEHRVAIGQRKLGLTSTAKSQMYFTEAEFYFDCTKEWDSEECNEDDNAGYSVQWRARLKRLQFPEIGSLISSFAGQFITKMEGYKAFQDKIKDGVKTKDKDGNVTTSPGNPLGSAWDQAIDRVFEDYVSKGITDNLDKVGKYMNPTLGAYH
ncbi:MAG: hypothetical protein JWP97_2236 [Labilithrix sp.]|nr:hypothetical protein [Labilithrix sp.]